MSSAERGGYRPEESRQPEREPVPYYGAARFVHERQSARTYQALQDLVYVSPADLSVYRFLLDQTAYVTVLSEPPLADLDRTITAHLASGVPAELPRGILLALTERRQRARRIGPWVEGHYGPDPDP